MRLLLAVAFVGALFGCATTSQPRTSTVQDDTTAASAMTNIQCWKGTSNAEQASNLDLCKAQAASDQVCETNMWVHEQGAFDVCLRGAPADKQLTVVSCYKGFNQADQDNNLAQCKASLGQGQVCETNAWKTGQGAYDVCIMQ